MKNNRLGYILILIACNIITASLIYSLTIRSINKQNESISNSIEVNGDSANASLSDKEQKNETVSNISEKAKENSDVDDKKNVEKPLDLVNQKIPVIFKDDPEKQRELEEAADKEPAFKEFLIGYPDNDGKVTGGFTEEEINAQFPHFLQYDKRWGYHEYGSSVMGFTGCAPTALSMVVLQLTENKSATPDKIADFCIDNNLYISGQGTTWNLFTQYSKHFGVQGTILPFNDERMQQELAKGHPIIISLKPGDFTKNGHIAVVVDYRDGKYVINDPGSNVRTSMLWDFETLIPQIKQLWVFQAI